MNEVETLRTRVAELEGQMVMLDKWGMSLIDKMGELIRKAATEGPLSTCIECRIKGDADSEGVPVVWLWASIDGEKSPEKRVYELARENERLRKLAALTKPEDATD